MGQDAWDAVDLWPLEVSDHSLEEIQVPVESGAKDQEEAAQRVSAF